MITLDILLLIIYNEINYLVTVEDYIKEVLIFN